MKRVTVAAAVVAAAFGVAGCAANNDAADVVQGAVAQDCRSVHQAGQADIEICQGNNSAWRTIVARYDGKIIDALDARMIHNEVEQGVQTMTTAYEYVNLDRFAGMVRARDMEGEGSSCFYELDPQWAPCP